MTGPAGVIHDIGYQRYQGARLGRWYALWTLSGHSLRTAYGLGRSAKAKIFPWLMVAIVGLIAAVATAARAATGEVALSYLDFVDVVFLLVILFCAVVAPELVSRDLRNGVLPLYFSRPLRRTDYAVAKLAATVTATGLLLVGPMLLMFVGALFTMESWAAFRAELGDFGAGLAYAVVHTLIVTGIALLIASLVGRRAVAAGIIVAVFLVTTPVVGVLEEAGGDTAAQLAGLANPATLALGVRHWWFGDGFPVGRYGPTYGAVALALVAVCAGLVLLRYRRVRV